MTDLLVIGASGQDGHFLLDQARAAGIDALGTSRQEREGFERVDPCDERELGVLLDRQQPRRIVLLAGQSSVGRSFADPRGTIRSHIAPVATCLEWMRTAAPDTRLIYAASGECFGARSAHDPAREDTPFAPDNPYAVGKCSGAMIVREYRRAFGLHAANAFLFNHESDRRPEQFVFGKLLAGLRRLQADGGGAPIELGNLDNIRDWGWAPDYAAAMLAMTRLDDPEDLVLATGTSVSLREAVEALVEAAGLSFAEAIRCDRADAERAHAATAQHADPGRARTAIGWTCSTPFPDLARRLMGGDA